MKRFGREFLRNPWSVISFLILTAFLVSAIFAPWIATHDPYDLALGSRFQLPSRTNWLGTDEVGRDIFSRVVYGGRTSLAIGAVSTSLAFIIGGVLGLFAGFFRRLDGVIMRFVDMMLAVPTILLAIAIVAALGPGLRNLMIAIAVGIIPTFARIMRSAVLPLRSIEYVQAAKAIGARDGYVVARIVAPNALPPLLVYGTLSLGTAILSAALLNFLGIGLDPAIPEWGSMTSAGRNYLRQAPHITFIPSLAIFLVVIAFNLLGDRLRDFMDPKQHA